MASLSLKWHYLRLYLPNVQFYAQFVAFCHTSAIVYNLQLKTFYHLFMKQRSSLKDSAPTLAQNFQLLAQ